MKEGRLWLTPEKESKEFECDDQYFSSKLEIVKINKAIVDKIKAKDELTAQEINRCALIRAAISSTMLDNPKARNEMPPYEDEFSVQNKALIQGYIEAQEELFYYLDAKDIFGNFKDRFLDHNLLPFIHQKLMKNNDDLSTKEKFGFRDEKSGLIQLSFFEPTNAKDITKSLGEMFVKYVNCDIDWNDINADRPINFANIAKAHAQFVRIQPFTDGNKRMAFILTNGMLKLQGLSPISICETEEESKAYMDALKEAIVNRNVTSLAEIFVDREISQQRLAINEATVSAAEKQIFGLENKTTKDANDFLEL